MVETRVLLRPLTPMGLELLARQLHYLESNESNVRYQ